MTASTETRAYPFGPPDRLDLNLNLNLDPFHTHPCESGMLVRGLKELPVTW